MDILPIPGLDLLICRFVGFVLLEDFVILVPHNLHDSEACTQQRQNCSLDSGSFSHKSLTVFKSMHKGRRGHVARELLRESTYSCSTFTNCLVPVGVNTISEEEPTLVGELKEVRGESPHLASLGCLYRWEVGWYFSPQALGGYKNYNRAPWHKSGYHANHFPQH
jgi:hypothetical protein